MVKRPYLGDTLIQDAVIRNLEVIGEAASRITAEYRTTHPEFPWRGMAALRNVLIHDYEGVDLQRVWRVVEKELPVLKIAIERILPPLEDLEREITGE